MSLTRVPLTTLNVMLWSMKLDKLQKIIFTIALYMRPFRLLSDYAFIIHLLIAYTHLFGPCMVLYHAYKIGQSL